MDRRSSIGWSPTRGRRRSPIFRSRASNCSSRTPKREDRSQAHVLPFLPGQGRFEGKFFASPPAVWGRFFVPFPSGRGLGRRPTDLISREAAIEHDRQLTI